MVKNLSLLGKFILLAVMIPLTAIVIAGIGLNKTSALKYEYDNLYGFMLIPITTIDQGSTQLAYLSDHIHQFAYADLSDADKTLMKNAIQTEDDNVAAVITRYNQEWVTTGSPEFTAVLKNLGKASLQTDEANALTQFKTAYDSFQNNLDPYLSGDAEVAEAIDQNLTEMRMALDSLVKVNMEFANLSNTSAQAAISQMTWSLIIAGIIASLLALGIALWLTRLVVTPITRLTRATGELAQGNLKLNFSG